MIPGMQGLHLTADLRGCAAALLAMTDVAADRRGIAESIRGRMERVGGTARITSRPGFGTEVHLVLPGPHTASGSSTASATDRDPS